jgi:hypothetical protein
MRRVMSAASAHGKKDGVKKTGLFLDLQWFV